MQQYQNSNGNSGILSYEIDLESITVQFKDGWFYLYTYSSAGASAIETMKQLATRGSGLNSYISTTVKTCYARKWRG